MKSVWRGGGWGHTSAAAFTKGASIRSFGSSACCNVVVRSKPKRRTKQETLRIQREIQQQHDMRENIKQVELYNSALKRQIWKNDDMRAQARAAAAQAIDTNREASEDDVKLLMDGLEDENLGLGLFEKRGAKALPQSIAERVGEKAVALVSLNNNEGNWGGVVRALYNNSEQLANIPLEDVNSFINSIPLQQRAPLMPNVYEMIDDAELVPNKFTYDLIIAAYAHVGDTVTVHGFIDQLKERGLKPDGYTYGHLLKSLSKNNDLEKSVQVLKEMQLLGHEPSLPVTTTLLQTCIRVGDYRQANSIFDMMKFQSTSTQPDLRVYNAMLLAAAKQYDINRVLDLYQEMTTRAIDPLQPNDETLTTLIYACARDPKTHLQAWKYLLEMQQRQYPITRKVINTLMYLCGQTGEVSFARALFKQLCVDPASYPDSYTLNSLFKVYGNFKPGQFSPILATALGNEIRSSFMFAVERPGQFHPSFTPPLLEMTLLQSKELVLLESRAVFAFMKEHHPQLVNQQTVISYLRIPAQLGLLAEFRKRYYDETFFAPSSTTMVVGENFGKIERSHLTFNLAIEACLQAPPSPQSLAFATEVWTQRGEWRKQSTLSKPHRDAADFQFARGMVNVLALNNETGDAIDLLKSCNMQFEWKTWHVEPLLNKLLQLDDHDNHRLVLKLVGRLKSVRNRGMREYSRVQGERDLKKIAHR